MTVRRATASDAPALAELRWRQLIDERGYGGTDGAAYGKLLSTWLTDHQQTHLAFLAELDARVVGMAWLMIAERVPTPIARSRLFGDVQSVVVTPDLRNGSIGAALLNALPTEAHTLNLEHVTVHSSTQAIPFYQRAGFEPDHAWLRWHPE
ncbi:GNAT family N-acetyltransferase [Actinoplanes sp. TBRC 11911]|uniref:GNAT family N-acetyltransferase n=1 Tax=Actinoplanes sp. TBRC 11911 TaxID=2729386 RepID=UPI00145F8873|nr:GNAT family N-acetyltransferase [Actinoplanes sp. TBRC 11911]NMO57604.1 GNAT family N-acetyltransferase [Actinoplanes sp. TBRC 11911]